MTILNYSKMCFDSLQQYLEYIKGFLHNLNELEQIRLIYLSLLSNDFAFDLEFAFGNRQTKIAAYNSCTYSEYTLNVLYKNKKILCKSLAYLFEYICNYFGYNVETITAEAEYGLCGHVYNGINLGNGIRFTVDPQKDLDNVQAHMKTKYFGLDYEQQGTVISEGTLEKIDYKLNYINEKGSYTDDYLYFLKKALQTPASLEEKMMLFVSNIEVYYDTTAMQYLARRWHYSELLLKFLTTSEYSRINILDCYSEDNHHRENFMCIIVNNEENGNIIFVFDNKERKFVRITDLETINRIQEELKSDVNSSSKVKKIGKISS